MTNQTGAITEAIDALQGYIHACECAMHTPEEYLVSALTRLQAMKGDERLYGLFEALHCVDRKDDGKYRKCFNEEPITTIRNAAKLLEKEIR